MQLKSQEMEVKGTVEACNILSSQESTGGDYQLTTTLYLPKGCSMLDMACLGQQVSMILLSILPNQHNKGKI